MHAAFLSHVKKNNDYSKDYSCANELNLLSSIKKSYQT